ncbi:MAG: LysM peptidoglycan-binding domain-containing protein [Thermoanaerobaculia bacterium]
MAPVLLLAMTIPASAAVPKSSSHPPRELHRVGDHWTPYSPPDPSTYPPNAKTHLIKAGETLWGIAAGLYGNGYLWPQLWESNTWITDAHWIYPGDVLLVGGETSEANVATGTTATTTTTGGKSSTETSTEEQGTGITSATMGRTEPTPIPLGTEADVYCYGYLGDPNESMPNKVASFEDVEVMFQPGAVVQTNAAVEGHLLYIDGGTSTGLVAGETYLAVSPQQLVYHPKTGELIGRNYDYRGLIRVLCADETHARAIITQSCKEIEVGTRLKPVPQLPIPIARVPDLPGFCDYPTGRNNAVIVAAAKDESLALGVGDLIQINIGRDDQLQPGDFLTVFRESPVAGQPRQVLGEIGVLTTENRTSTAKIVAMRRAMVIGDLLERR